MRSVCFFFFRRRVGWWHNFQRSKVSCILFSWVRGEVAGTRRLRRQRRQRPSLPFPNSLVTRVLSLPSSYFYPVRLYDVFLCNEESKTLNRRLVGKEKWVKNRFSLFWKLVIDDLSSIGVLPQIGATKRRSRCFPVKFISLRHFLYTKFCIIISLRKPCHMPFRKLIPLFTLTGSLRHASVILNQIDVYTMDVNNKIKE